MDAFDRRVMFFRAVARSQGTSALTMALIRNEVTPQDRPAVRAARLLQRRSSGADRRRRVALERQDFTRLREDPTP